MCITGWRRPLTMKDVYRLNEKAESETLSQKWDRYWKPRVDKFIAKRDYASKNTVDMIKFGKCNEETVFVSNQNSDVAGRSTCVTCITEILTVYT